MITSPIARSSKDFLDEIVAERAEANPGFPQMVDAAYERRLMLCLLAACLCVLAGPSGADAQAKPLMASPQPWLGAGAPAPERWSERPRPLTERAGERQLALSRAYLARYERASGNGRRLEGQLRAGLILRLADRAAVRALLSPASRDGAHSLLGEVAERRGENMVRLAEALRGPRIAPGARQHAHAALIDAARRHNGAYMLMRIEGSPLAHEQRARLGELRAQLRTGFARRARDARPDAHMVRLFASVSAIEGRDLDASGVDPSAPMNHRVLRQSALLGGPGPTILRYGQLLRDERARARAQEPAGEPDPRGDEPFEDDPPTGEGPEQGGA